LIDAHLESSNGSVRRSARLLLIRHGESTWNALGLWQGQEDPPLSPRGESQVIAAAEKLAGTAFDTIVSSDLRRASSTAAILAEQLGVADIVLDAGLREVDVGHWIGLTRTEIELRWPGMRAAWSENRLPSAPGGELLTAFTDRAVRAVRRAARLAADGPVLVIGHNKVISTLERFAGLQPLRVSHLSGRWFEVEPSGDLRGLEAVNLLAGIPEPTPT
jgi:probable phosphoglycerate mutase